MKKLVDDEVELEAAGADVKSPHGLEDAVLVVVGAARARERLPGGGGRRPPLEANCTPPEAAGRAGAAVWALPVVTVGLAFSST